jgi:hypothetical protein
MFRLTWLPQVLRDAGLNVVEVPGWQERGHGDMVADIRGVLLHHDAGRLHESDKSLINVLVEGRPDLKGPLAQLGLNESGTYFVIAAGRCYHAGPGAWPGISVGNTYLIGIEAANTGLPNDPWEDVQMSAYLHGVAAILKHCNLPFSRAIGHKEWAPHRKSDPSFDMTAFRKHLQEIMGP